MPGNACSICTHPKCNEINRALAGGDGDGATNATVSVRGTALRFGVGIESLRRHSKNHLTDGFKKTIVKHAELVAETKDMDVLASLSRAAERLEKFLDAADAWLRDPNDPTRYNLGPRDHEVIVIWEREIDIGDGVRCITERKKEPLADILRRCGEKSDTAPKLGEIRTVEVKHGDPRKLLLDAMTAGKPLLELLGKAMGQIKPDPGMSLNVFLAGKEWQRIESAIVSALGRHPHALDDVVRVLESAKDA